MPGPFFDKKLNVDDAVLITSSTTTEIFTGTGVLQAITIWTPVDGSTFYFTDGDDAIIAGIPKTGATAQSSSLGKFGIPESGFTVTNGLKVVTTDATGIVMTVWAYTP
jgi:hypothetical protein